MPDQELDPGILPDQVLHEPDIGRFLRFALNAPPYGRRRASLRARPTNKQNPVSTGKTLAQAERNTKATSKRKPNVIVLIGSSNCR